MSGILDNIPTVLGCRFKVSRFEITATSCICYNYNKPIIFRVLTFDIVIMS